MLYKRRKTLSNGREVDYPHWWYRFKRNGVLIRVNTKQPNKRAAEEMEAAHRTRLAKGEVGLRDHRAIPTLKRFERRFIEAAKVRCGGKTRTAEFYESRMACLLAFEPLASTRLDQIDEALIERYVQSRTGKASRSTINGDLATLRRSLRLAQEWRVLDRVPRIRLLSGEHVRDFVLKRAQENAYLEAAPDPLKDIALLILDTGLRLGEALGLEWTDVNLDPGKGKRFGFLQIRAGKTKNARRAVSLTERAVKMLRERRTTSICQWVFPGEGQDKAMGTTSVSHQHKRVRDKLKLSGEFVVHSLRHTMLTRLGEAGVDAFTIMRIAGHSTIIISQRYVHPSAEAMESAFEKLEAANQPARGRRGHRAGTPRNRRKTNSSQVVAITSKLA